MAKLSFCCRLILAFLPAVAVCVACSAEEITVPTASGEELVAERFRGNGGYLMLWFAPEYGFRSNHRVLAKKLAEGGIEVWLSNIPESLFLPNGTQSIRELDGSHVADMIDYAHDNTGKKIVVSGDSYGAVVALVGARRWQQRRHEDSRFLIGAILFSPYAYASIPPLGELPEYLPIVSATNIPIGIYQTTGSAIFSQFKTLLEQLQQHGSPVYTELVPDIMSLFYQDPPTEAMARHSDPMPSKIGRMLTALEGHPLPTLPIAVESDVSIKSGIDVYLKEFQGSVTPRRIELQNTSGNKIIYEDFKGKVTLINFWATWCPPCVEEIPSLNRLRSKMSDSPFELISINYAEENSDIQSFMKRVRVDFPVLLDQDGQFAREWKVISYPSTFIIDPKGVIRYGVNAAIDWDDPEVIAKLKSLLGEPR